MKRFLFLLIFGISIANFTFTSCDGDNGLPDTPDKHTINLMKEYDSVLDYLISEKKELAEWEAKLKTATGSYREFIQSRIAEKKAKIRQLEERKEQLETELNIK